MPKFLYRFLPFLLALSAYAEVEAPVEKASPATVIIFLFLFVGSIAGYFVYTWWNQRKNRERGEE